MILGAGMSCVVMSKRKKGKGSVQATLIASGSIWQDGGSWDSNPVLRRHAECQTTWLKADERKTHHGSPQFRCYPEKPNVCVSERPWPLFEKSFLYSCLLSFKSLCSLRKQHFKSNFVVRTTSNPLMPLITLLTFPA